jgi:alpha-tubulin suppressor-like RCC1 family protein
MSNYTIDSVDIDTLFVDRSLTTFDGVPGALYTTGGNTRGQLGLGDITATSTLVQVGSEAQWQDISTGSNSITAIKADGTLWSWGDDTYGKLGQGTADVHLSSPVQVGSDTNWMQSSSSLFVLAKRTDNTLWGFGLNTSSQIVTLGDSMYSVPTQIGNLSDWKLIATTWNGAFAIKSDGTFWSWGAGSFGQLGKGDTSTKNSPTQVGTDTWLDIGTSQYSVCLVRSDGTLWTTGRNESGQLGQGDIVDRSTLTQIGSDTDWAKCTIGDRSAQGAIKTNGTLYTWGFNFYGGLGHGDTVYKSSPVQVGALTDWKNASLSEGMIAVKNDGTLWGTGTSTYIGLGSPTIDYSSPTQVGSDTTWILGMAGFQFSPIIKT